MLAETSFITDDAFNPTLWMYSIDFDKFGPIWDVSYPTSLKLSTNFSALTPTTFDAAYNWLITFSFSITFLFDALAISIMVFETSSKVPPNFSTPAAESVKAIFISSILALLKPKLLLSLSACATIKPNASLKVWIGLRASLTASVIPVTPLFSLSKFSFSAI